MKKLLILLIVIIAGYILFLYFYKEDVVEIKDRIISGQASSLDINSGPSPPPKFAYIEGSVKNVGDKNLQNIKLIYTIGNDTLSCTIGSLNQGESIDFKTNSRRVRGINPSYSLEEISYDEQ